MGDPLSVHDEWKMQTACAAAAPSILILILILISILILILTAILLLTLTSTRICISVAEISIWTSTSTLIAVWTWTAIDLWRRHGLRSLHASRLRWGRLPFAPARLVAASRFEAGIAVELLNVHRDHAHPDLYRRGPWSQHLQHQEPRPLLTLALLCASVHAAARQPHHRRRTSSSECAQPNPATPS